MCIYHQNTIYNYEKKEQKKNSAYTYECSR